MMPKIIFKYSWIYDQKWKEWMKVYRPDKKYPSPQKIQNYIKKVEILWLKDEKKVLAELSNVAGLKWKEKTIICYFVGNGISFSDPLTLRIYNKADYCVDILIHELIHQLFIQNEANNWNVWKYFHKKYKADSFKTRIHIPVHAIHWHIFLKFYGEKRLKREIKLMSKYIDYKKAWDIVEKEGYQNIIQNLRERAR